MINRFRSAGLRAVTFTKEIDFKNPRKYVIPLCALLVLIAAGTMAATKTFKDDVTGVSRDPLETITELSLEKKESLEYLNVPAGNTPVTVNPSSFSEIGGDSRPHVNFLNASSEDDLPKRYYSGTTKTISQAVKTISLDLSLSGENPSNIWPQAAVSEDTDGSNYYSPIIIIPDDLISGGTYVPDTTSSGSDDDDEDVVTGGGSPVPIPSTIVLTAWGLIGIFVSGKRSIGKLAS